MAQITKFCIFGRHIEFLAEIPLQFWWISPISYSFRDKLICKLPTKSEFQKFNFLSFHPILILFLFFVHLPELPLSHYRKSANFYGKETKWGLNSEISMENIYNLYFSSNFCMLVAFYLWIDCLIMFNYIPHDIPMFSIRSS